MALSGIEDDSEPTFDELETKAEFTAFAERIGEMFAKRAGHEHYSLFVREMLKITCKPSEPSTRFGVHSSSEFNIQRLIGLI